MTSTNDALPERMRRISRREYDALIALGAFADQRVELLRGVIVDMVPPGPSHSVIVDRLTETLVLALLKRAWLRVQNPLAATDDSAPQPDLCVVARADYSQAHPTSAHLAIEVADSSLRQDRRIKTGIYADAGVPEYWIVNVSAQEVEVRSHPARGDYTELRTYRRGDVITLQAFPDVAVDVARIFDAES